MTDDKIVITRRGVTGLAVHGLKGAKEIAIDQVTAIQFKKASLIANGYIQFSSWEVKIRNAAPGRRVRTRTPSFSVRPAASIPTSRRLTVIADDRPPRLGEVDRPNHVHEIRLVDTPELVELLSTPEAQMAPGDPSVHFLHRAE